MTPLLFNVQRLFIALLIAAPLVAICCWTVTTPCSSMRGAAIVFVGRVVANDGQGRGRQWVRFLIEERLSNVPKELVEVDVDAREPASRFEVNEQYVVFAEKRGGTPFGQSLDSGSNTFAVRGEEHIVDALRSVAQGGPARLVGRVRRRTPTSRDGASVPGVVVTARSPAATYQTITDAFGRYEFRGVMPGLYSLDVAKDGFVPDTVYNRGWTKLVTWKKGNEPGTVSVDEGHCEVRDLRLWAGGRISGKLTNAAGQPLGDVMVQAFALGSEGEPESIPLRTAATGRTGSYSLEPLPAGDYVVAVNGARHLDANPYPRTFTSRISNAEGEHAGPINMVLPPQRTPATLRVALVGPSGGEHAFVTLWNLEGHERWSSRMPAPIDGVLEVPVYHGEKYVVEAGSSVWRRGSGHDYLTGSAPIEILRTSPSIVVILGRN